MQKGPEVLDDYIELVAQKVRAGTVGKKPRFRDPREELNLSKTWTGEVSPGLFQDLLVGNDRAIDHSLYEANAQGVVKFAAGGSFVSLRSHVNFRGKDIGTNAGVHVRALVDNASRRSKSYVREEAKAVVVFLHGGGTKTTGHHVGISMQNFLSAYGIDTVTIDLPWHGEGPRETFGTTEEILEYVRAFIEQKLKASGKPVFIAGHSWGGYLADAYMELYPKSRDHLVSGVISLSGVPDLVPGGSPLEKILAENAKAIRDITDDRIDANDKAMGDGLFRQNKVSPVAGAHVIGAMRKMNWHHVDHQGRDYLPTLMVMGKGDALYVGAESVWHEYRERLVNVQWEMVNAGHLIFDFEKDGSPPVYLLIKDFVAKTIDQKLEKAQKASREVSDYSVLSRLAIEWFNRPVFREFVKHTNLNLKVPTAKFHELDRKLKALREYTIAIEAINRNKKLSADDKTSAINALPHFVDAESGESLSPMDAVAERNRLFAIQVGKYVPPGLAGQKAEAYLLELDELGKKVLDLSRRRDDLKKLLSPASESIKDRGAKDQKELAASGQVQFDFATYSRELKTYNELLKSTQSPELHHLQAQSEILIQRAIEADQKVRIQVDEYLSHLEAQGKLESTEWMEALPDSILASFARLEKSQAEFQNSNKRIEGYIRSAAFNGYFGTDLKDRSHRLFGPNGMEAELRRLTLQVTRLDREVIRATLRIHELRNLYVLAASDKYFNVETYPVEKLVSGPADKWLANKGLLEKVIALWDAVWDERMLESSTSAAN